MKNSHKKKIYNKLKKVSVWPTIIIFFITMFCSVVVGIVFTVYSCTNVIDEKYKTAVETATLIERLVDRLEKEGNDTKQAMKKAQELGFEFQDAFYIDQDNEIIDGIGVMTADRELMEAQIGDMDLSLFPDVSQRDLFTDDEKLNFQLESILEGALLKSDQVSTDEWMERKLAEYLFWIVVPTEDQNVKFMVKIPVVVLRQDMYTAIIAIIVGMVLFSIPMILMLINAISSIANQSRMRKLILFDEVTGGNNWTAFREGARKIVQRYANRNKCFAIVDFEIMKYRSYCACHGVEEGELLLENAYNKITKQLTRNEICGRYGRANFAILLCSPSEEAVSEKIVKLMENMKDVGGKHRLVTHAGYYFIDEMKDAKGRQIPRKKVDIAKLYNNASAARASIPSNEESMSCGFTDKLLEDQLWEHKVEDRMEEALGNKEFAVFYQPKYNPVTDELAGAEALIRWIEKDGNIVPPGKFIPIFENNGFITRIDDYMISAVARQQKQWLSEGKNVVPVSVNVSRAHFTQSDLAEHILALVDEQGAPHHLVEIELTESAFFDDKNALLTTVRKLKEYGFEISMDDFGAGYSSLNSLKDLPLDVLKLDAEFFRGDLADDRGEIVVSEAITLAKQLNMRIVAEGIEKKEQVDFLATKGCDMIQGYYFAKPMPAEDYVERMRQKTYVS